MTATEGDVKDLLVNPFYAVSFQDYLFSVREPSGAKEDWVLLNAKLMDDTGPKKWLNQLLDVLSLDHSTYDGDEIINPTIAVPLSEDLQGEHEPLVTKDQWIEANIKLVKEIGTTAWLWQLLRVLESGTI